MKRKHFEFAAIFLLVLSFAVAKVESEQPQEAALGRFDHIDWEVHAPKDIKVGQSFVVTFNFWADLTLNISRMDVGLYGNFGQGGTLIIWKESWTDTIWISGVPYTKTANVTAARAALRAASVGEVFAHIYAVYDDALKVHHFEYVDSEVTRIWDTPPGELQSNYYSLNQSYDNLQNTYHSLESKYSALNSSLNSARVYIVVLAIATLLLIVTTIYLERSRYYVFAKKLETEVSENGEARAPYDISKAQWNTTKPKTSYT